MRTLWLFLMIGWFLPLAALAVWAEPSCDPAVDPTVCNVSAPLNVSSTDQSKAGGLNIDGTFTVGGSLTVNGTNSIFASPAIFNGSLTAANSFVFSGSAGNFTLTPDSIEDADVSNNLTASQFIMGSASVTPAVDLNTTEVTGTLPASAITDLWVNTTSDTMTGTLTVQPTASNPSIISSGFSNQALVSLNPTGTSASSAGLSVSVSSPLANGIIVSPTGIGTTGSGILISSSAGRPGMLIDTTGTGYPIVITSRGSAVHGIDVVMQGSSATGVIASATQSGGTGVSGAGDSYGGYFTAGSGTGVVGLGVLNGVLGNSTSGAGVSGSSTSGNGGYFTSSSGTGVRVDATGSVYGVDIVGTSATTTGLHINNAGLGASITSNSMGVNITVPDYNIAVEANNGVIHSTGGFRGGQFYANEASGSSMYPDVEPNDLQYISFGTLATGRSLLYDGGSIWVGLYRTGSPSTQINRMSTMDGHQVYTNASVFPDAGVLTMVNDLVYAFYNDGNYVTYDRYDGTVGGAILSASINPTATMYDGQSIWLGTANRIYQWSDLRTNSITARAINLGNISDIVYADGFIWAADSSNDLVYKINPNNYARSSIAVGDNPVTLVYDGQYIWVANDAAIDSDDSLTRINTQDDSTNAVPISVLGADPTTLVFDGIHIWIGFNAYGVGYYNVATNSTGKYNTLDNASIYDMVFDGTYLWALKDDGVYQIPTGTGHGNDYISITDGILMYDRLGVVHCVYINGGNVTATTSLTSCQ